MKTIDGFIDEAKQICRAKDWDESSLLIGQLTLSLLIVRLTEALERSNQTLQDRLIQSNGRKEAHLSRISQLLESQGIQSQGPAKATEQNVTTKENTSVFGKLKNLF